MEQGAKDSRDVMFLLDSQVVKGRVRCLFKTTDGKYEAATVPFMNYFLRRPKDKADEGKIPFDKMMFGYPYEEEHEYGKNMVTFQKYEFADKEMEMVTTISKTVGGKESVT